MRCVSKEGQAVAKGFALVLGLALLGLFAHAPIGQAEDKVLFLPEDVLNSSEMVNKWGSGTCTRTDVAGPGVQFNCTGITGWGTMYADDWPLSPLVRCSGADNEDCSAFVDGDGDDKYRMRFENLHSSCAISVAVSMNTGFGGQDGYYQSGWTWVGPSSSGLVELDLNNAAECYNYCPNGGTNVPVINLNQTTNAGFQFATFDACDLSFNIVVSAFAEETSATVGNNQTISCPGHSLQGYNPAGTLYYNDFDEGFRGYADLSGLLPNHDYLLSFEGLAADVALTSNELASCGVIVNDGGRNTTPGGTWPASGGGEFEGMQVVFVDFELITTDGSGDYSNGFFFDCDGLISEGDLFKTRFILKDAHSWSIHDCTGGWENEALYADNVDFDPPFDEDGDGHSTESEEGAGSDPGDATSMPLQETRWDGGRRARAEGLIGYANELQKKVVPVAPDRYVLIVNWGATVHPETLVARLNGQDVAHLFEPVIPGTTRAVTLTLERPKRVNKLVLKIKGEVLNRRGNPRLRADRDTVKFLTLNR